MIIECITLRILMFVFSVFWRWQSFLFCTESLKEKPVGTMYSLLTGTNVRLTLFAKLKIGGVCYMGALWKKNFAGFKVSAPAQPPFSWNHNQMGRSSVPYWKPLGPAQFRIQIPYLLHPQVSEGRMCSVLHSRPIDPGAVASNQQSQHLGREKGQWSQLGRIKVTNGPPQFHLGFSTKVNFDAKSMETFGFRAFELFSWPGGIVAGLVGVAWPRGLLVSRKFMPLLSVSIPAMEQMTCHSDWMTAQCYPINQLFNFGWLHL